MEQGLILQEVLTLRDGTTVLDNITSGLQDQGFANFVFCTGHHRELLQDHIDSGRWLLNDEVGYRFSHEDSPLGPDGAVIKAIRDLALEGEALILPGDFALSWGKLAEMIKYRKSTGSDITLAVTSYITPRTTDVGKLIANRDTGVLERCYGRQEPVDTITNNQIALTSAAAMSIDIGRYLEICEAYLRDNPGEERLGMRDGIAPWLSSRDTPYKITVFDIESEILDLGTPGNIRFGQEHLRNE